jgi:predicted nucleotidyltransferase
VVDDALITRLSEAAPRARVILFGSHARGEAGQRSDVDFLVVEPEVEDEAAESVRLRKALRGLLVPAEVIVVSEDRVHEWRNVPGSLVHVALAEGIDLAV